MVQLQTTHNATGKTTYCQIFLFPSHPGAADAMQNFTAEWARLVAQPFGRVGMPRPETQTSPDGWTAVTGSANVVQRGIPVTAILFTVTGHDRVMSVLINDAGPEYGPAVRAFFSGDYGSLLGTRLVAVQLGHQVGIITSTGKDPEVSMCFGEIVHDDWPPFFYSIRFKNWTPVPQEHEVPRRLAGMWTTATASVADRYTFAPNGRYASAAAAMTTTRISPTELLQTTNAYFGDGAYAISGNSITLTSDNDRGNPKRGHFRLEQDSKDGGAAWVDRLCLLLDGISGEVCYDRDQGP